MDRTVYIGPIKPHIVTKIEKYFKGFGSTEFFSVRTENSFHYGLVQFKSVEDAKKVLERSPHRIAKCLVMATAYCIPFAPGYNPWAPDYESESNILNALNDDCLQLVFTHLSKFDLANAADVCVRFNQHAKRAFVAKHKEKTVEISNLRNESLSHQDDEFENKSVPIMFRNFGSLIEKLVIKNCRFLNTSDPKDYIASAFSFLRDLKVLHIIGNKWDSPLLMNQRFAKLEEFHLIWNSTITHEERETTGNMELCDFLTANQTLKNLSIVKYGFDYSVSDVIRLIGQHQKNLVKLRIDKEIFGDSRDLPLSVHVNSSSNLKSLKSLTLNLTKLDIDDVLHHLVVDNAPIEELTLMCANHGAIKDRHLRIFSRLKQIKRLNLQYLFLYERQLIEWISKLPLLQQLIIHQTGETMKKIMTHATKLSKLVVILVENLVIDVDDYESMLQSVQNRPEKVPLRIDVIVCRHTKSTFAVVNVAQKILQKNRDCIDIQIHIH